MEKLKQFLFSLLVFSMALSTVWLIGKIMNAATGGGIYGARCWVKDDAPGIQKTTNLEAVRQQPFDCKDFEKH